LISDGDEVDRLIDKTIQAFKNSWKSLKKIDKTGAYMLIYSAKVKNLFLNLLIKDPSRTIDMLIRIFIKTMIMEFEATHVSI
jgi:hypothetical protein